MGTQKLTSQSVLTFDGVDDYINFGDTDLSGVLSEGSSTFTILGWVKPNRLNQEATNHGTRNVFFAKASDGNNDNLELGISPDGNLDVYLDENQDDITKTFGQGELTIGQWHFFGVVFNQGQITVYLDEGQYSGSFKGTSLDQAKGSPLTLGVTLHIDTYFSGQIAKISVWNYCCSLKEIKNYRDQPLRGNETGLVAYWPLNEGKGTFVEDQGPKNYQGTFQGSPKWEVAEVPFNIPPEQPLSISTPEEPQKSPNLTDSPKKYRILAIDGGGMRAIIPGLLLAEIEKRTRKPIFELFDLIAGTSTGGILALGLTKPRLTPLVPDSSPTAQYTAEDLVQIYTEYGAEIFYEPFFEKLLGPIEDILAQPKYSSEGREEILTEFFGNVPLRNNLKEVFVTSYDIEQRIPIFFTNKLEKQDTESRTFRKLCFGFTVKDAAMATTASPTYFAPYRVPTCHNPNGFYTLVDGGVIANNPAYLALAEAKLSRKSQQLLAPDDILMVSLGTGSLTTIYPYDDVQKWGLLQWSRPLLNMISDGGSEVVAGELERLFESEGCKDNNVYFRFQTFLPGEQEVIDNATPENIRQLKVLARRLIIEKSKEIDKLCHLLLS